MLVNILILLALILINGFFSCAELAVLSVNPNKVKLRADKGDKKAALLKKTLEFQDHFLSTIQIAISLVGLFSGAFAGQTFAGPVVERLISMGIKVPEQTLTNVVVLLITVLLSYFTLVLGELVPKRLALTKTDAVAEKVIGPVTVLSKIFKPFVRLLSVSTKFVTKLLGIYENDNAELVTEEEIRIMVDVSGGGGNIQENEMEMINKVFDFDVRTAEDISTHRTDIFAIDIDEDISVITKEVSNMKYSRVPVYEGSIDNIIGILHLKDFMKYLISYNFSVDENGTENLRKILRKAYFVPASKKTDSLFADMKKAKVHAAVVIDEYGGTVGLVTMEDLVEEIMGNILDEYDDEEVVEFRQIDDETYEIIGTCELKELNDELDAGLPEDEFETIGGFLISQIGYIPSENETFEVTYNDILFKVISMEDKRIDKIIAVKKVNEEAETAE